MSMKFLKKSIVVNVPWRHYTRNEPDQIMKLLKGVGIKCPRRVRSRKKIGPPTTVIPRVKPEAHFIVNTCRKYFPLAYQDMLKNEKAAAYGDRRHAVSGIKRGDAVFLYHSQIGVIAFGKALDGYKDDSANEEYYVPLKFDWRIDPNIEPQRAVTASEINQKLNSKYPFMKAVWSISEEMAQVIQDIAALK